MITSLILDVALSIVILIHLNQTAEAIPYWTPFTSFILVELFDRSHEKIAWIFTIFYCLFIFILSSLLAAGLIIIRTLLSNQIIFLEIVLVFLIPNLIFFHSIIFECLLNFHLSKNNFINFIVQLSLFIERTIGLIFGGVMVWLIVS